MRLWVYRLLERALSSVGEVATDWSQRFAYCPDCGRNRYSGAPCVGEE